jgi:hypothetical protein
MPYLGKGDCQNCGREVDVSLNVRGMAYYRCGPCGFKGQQSTQRGNDAFVRTVRREVEEEAAPPPAKCSESQEIADAEPATMPAAKPGKTLEKTAPRRGLFGGVLRG